MPGRPADGPHERGEVPDPPHSEERDDQCGAEDRGGEVEVEPGEVREAGARWWHRESLAGRTRWWAERVKARLLEIHLTKAGRSPRTPREMATR